MFKELLLSTFFTLCSGASLGQVGHDLKLAPRQENNLINNKYLYSKYFTDSLSSASTDGFSFHADVVDNKLQCGDYFYLDFNNITLDQSGYYHGSNLHYRLRVNPDSYCIFPNYDNLEKFNMIDFYFSVDLFSSSSHDYQLHIFNTKLSVDIYDENEQEWDFITVFESNSRFYDLTYYFDLDGSSIYYFDSTPELVFIDSYSLYSLWFYNLASNPSQVIIDADFQPAFWVSNFVYSNNTFAVNSTGSWSSGFYDVLGLGGVDRNIIFSDGLSHYYDVIFESNGQLFNGIRINMSDCTYILNGEGKPVDYSDQDYMLVYNIQYHLLDTNGLDGFINVANVNATRMNVGTLTEPDIQTVYGPSSNIIWRSDKYRTITILKGADYIPFIDSAPAPLSNLNVVEILSLKGNYYAVFAGEGIGDGISLIRLAVDGLIPMLNVMILPGITIGLLLFIPLITTLIVVVVRMVKK